MPVYSAGFAAYSIQNAEELLNIIMPSGSTAELLEVTVEQYSDYGDAQEEGTRIRFLRNDDPGAGGTSVTARPHSVADPAFQGSILRNVAFSLGTVYQIFIGNWQLSRGFFWKPQPDAPIELSLPSGGAQDIFAICMEANLADPVIMQMNAVFKEMY